MPRNTYHHGHLREELIAASLKIIAKKGLSALSLREAAKRAGVSSAAPYRHFPTKEALLAAIATQGNLAIGRFLQEEVEQHPDDVAAQMMHAAKAYIQYAMREPATYRVMCMAMNQAQYPELKAAHEQTESMFLEMIRKGQAQNLIHDGDALDLATAAYAFLHGLATMLIDQQLCEHFCPPGTDMDAWLERMILVIWNGYAKHPSSAPARR